MRNSAKGLTQGHTKLSTSFLKKQHRITQPSFLILFFHFLGKNSHNKTVFGVGNKAPTWSHSYPIYLFQLLIKIYEISTIKGIAFNCATDVDDLGCPLPFMEDGGGSPEGVWSFANHPLDPPRFGKGPDFFRIFCYLPLL